MSYIINKNIFFTGLLTVFIMVSLSLAGSVAAVAKTPDSFADMTEALLPTVVNISTTQKVKVSQNNNRRQVMPFGSFPEGSPFNELFDELFKMPFNGMENEPEMFKKFREFGQKEFKREFGNKENGDLEENYKEYNRPNSLGSGFIIDAKKGYVVTNNHVIEGADNVKVTLYDDTVLDAEIIGRDEKTDLAVLKVDTDHPLTAVSWGSSDQSRVGDWVLAIGNPFGLGGTVTAGIISARQRDINAGPYDDFIQTDASINRGNSGGPMFNVAGEVIGINTAIYSTTGGSVGIGFAIPSTMAKSVVKQLIEFGRTRRGWLGVRIQSVTDEIAQSLGLDKARGALVSSTVKESPAEKAGVKTGDVIILFDGRDIESVRTLPRIVAETDISSDVTMTVWRDGKKKKIAVRIGDLEMAEDLEREEKEEPDTAEKETPISDTQLSDLGLSVATLSHDLRKDFKIADDVDGVVITAIDKSSEAGRKRLKIGDVILQANQQEVTRASQLESIIAKGKKEGKKNALLLIYQEGASRFVALSY